MLFRSGNDSENVDRLPVLISSLVDDGNTKLLGVPKLLSRKAAADVILDLLNSWQCSTLVIGMCFNTTAANTGKVNGTCTLLENLAKTRQKLAVDGLPTSHF